MIDQTDRLLVVGWLTFWVAATLFMAGVRVV